MIAFIIIGNSCVSFTNVRGVNHRIKGPAVMYRNGTGYWEFNGKKHRLDGPAVEDGMQRVWYVHDDRLSFTKSVMI